MADVEQLYKRAEEAFTKKNYDYSVELFNQILLLDPNHEKSRKGIRAAVLQKFKEKGAPGRLKLKMFKAKVYGELKIARNKPDKRVAICQKFLLQDPNADDIRAELSAALLAKNANAAAQFEGEMATETNPANAAAYKNLVEAYRRQGLIKEAQTALNRVLEIVPSDRELQHLQRQIAAETTMEKGFRDSADGEEGYKNVMKDEDKAKQLERATQLIKNKDQAKLVIRDLAEVMEKDPDYKVARKIAEVHLQHLNDPQGAKKWFTKASELNTHDSVLRDKIEDCTIKMFDMKIAQLDSKKDPSLTEMKVKKLKFQIQAFERRAQDRPTDMSVQFDLGRSYFAAGPSFLDKSIGAFQQAMKDPKKKMDSFYFLGLAFQKKKMYDMADAQFTKALSAGVVTQMKKLSILYFQAVNSAEGGDLEKAISIGKEIMEADISYKDISALVSEWMAQK